ncbi:MAG: glycoside hydrolase family 43 protein, partial [Lachnospiraceae bacterium]|nr:glycoside hydrolase family 43 protein [Lachnospiraceae bacterium]
LLALSMGACLASCKEAASVSEEPPVKEEIVADMDFTVSYDGIDTSKYSAGISVHDPSIVAADDKYYIVGSHMTMAYTSDLKHWAYSGNGYSSTNKVFGDIFTDPTGEIYSFTGKRESIVPTDDNRCHVWAPDIIYNRRNNLYYMYYCTSSTWNASTLEYATCETIDGKYEYAGTILSSGFTAVNYDKTNVLDYVDEATVKKTYIKPDRSYNFNLWPNAIDPTVFYDKEGRMWMVYGSWSGGIFLLEIDEETGNAIHPETDTEHEVDAYFGKKLLGGGHKSIEGPYIVYDSESDYYYLFVSYGELTADGGYQIRVFRSKTVDGDYVDMNGKKPGYLDNDHAGFGLKLSGNYRLPSLDKAYKATGHNSALIDTDGKKYLAYHTRFEKKGEFHEPRIKQYFLNKEGWPVLLPYTYDGETISEKGYEASLIAGRYFFVNQGTAIDSEIAEPVIIYLDEAGTVYSLGNDGETVEGAYTLENGTPYMTITIGGITYSGVFCRQNDEAGAPVMTFTAVGDNASVWGVKY